MMDEHHHRLGSFMEQNADAKKKAQKLHNHRASMGEHHHRLDTAWNKVRVHNADAQRNAGAQCGCTTKKEIPLRTHTALQPQTPSPPPAAPAGPGTPQGKALIQREDRQWKHSRGQWLYLLRCLNVGLVDRSVVVDCVEIDGKRLV